LIFGQDAKVGNPADLRVVVQPGGDKADGSVINFGDKDASRVGVDVGVHLTLLSILPVFAGNAAKEAFDVLVNGDAVKADYADFFERVSVGMSVFSNSHFLRTFYTEVFVWQYVTFLQDIVYYPVTTILWILVGTRRMEGYAPVLDKGWLGGNNIGGQEKWAICF